MKKLITLALLSICSVGHTQSNVNINKGATPVEVENGPNNPVPVVTQSSNGSGDYQYIGTTEDETAGVAILVNEQLVGIPVLNRMCQAAFGAAARAATTEDLNNVVAAVPDSPKIGAWVVPSYPVTPYANGLGGYDTIDAAGVRIDVGAPSPASAVTGAACGRFGSHAGSSVSLGPIWRQSGDFTIFVFDFGDCTTPRKVACSSPRVVPLFSN